MTGGSVIHETFVVKRRLARPGPRVFAAWADPAAKAHWFAAPDGEYELDFRVGGVERNRGRTPRGEPVEFESLYREIVPGQRIVYTSTLTLDGALATVSVTTVEFQDDDSNTLLVLTESGAFLDGREAPAQRREGTAGWLDRLGAVLQAPQPHQAPQAHQAHQAPQGDHHDPA
jgi:uncharacterized protein YndB with AHSA1/START domain